MIYLHNKIHIWRKKTFINSSIFSGCLHSKDKVLHAHPNLLENMLLYQPPRWCNRISPRWVLISPMLSFLPCPKPFWVPNPQALAVLVLPWHRNPVWVYANNKPIGPLHFPIFLQWGLNFFPIIHHYYWDWMTGFLTLGSLFL